MINKNFYLAIGASYFYIGWIMDRLGANPEKVSVLNQLPEISMLIDYLHISSYAEDTFPIQFAIGAYQLVSNNLEAVAGLLEPSNTTDTQRQAILKAIEQDITGHSVQYYRCGNGGGNTIYRLREGIE
ncbi:MAG TPA: hypothetical protein PLX23_10400 [Candidatus Hydrogenedens sp.]|nr:hypothetical protein [Candidatus Hydrogenedens sp.]